MNERKTIEIPIQTRMAAVGPMDMESMTFPVTWTTGAAVNRSDFWSGDSWLEELSCDPSSVRMDRMNSGAPLLNAHNRFDLSGVIGVVENAKVDGTKGTATVRLSRRADVQPIAQDVQDKIIRNVSVGYRVFRYDDVSTPEDMANRTRRKRAMDWEPSEVSLVPVGADAGAGVGRAALPTNPCDIDFSERSEPIVVPPIDQSTAGTAAPLVQRGAIQLRRLQDQAERE
jgi:hypothetical protein